MNGSSSAPQVLERFTWLEVDSDDVDAEVNVLLRRLDKRWQALLEASGQRKQDLIEIFLQLGRRPKAIFDTGVSKETVFLTDGDFCERVHIERFIESLGWRERLKNSKVKSACLPTTLHRISLITKGEGDDVAVIGLNARVGRSWTGVLMQMCPWLITSKTMRVAPGLPPMSLSGQSVLFIGRPGAGKTTLLREMAHALARVSSNNRGGAEKTVVVVDKINEIAGDFEVPHACIGEARWMPCGSPDLHSEVMREAVENAAPDVVIVDEISTAEEVDSAVRTGERGVSLIATIHGNTLVDTLNCSVRQRLLGMPQTAGTPREGYRSLQRVSAPSFDVCIELHQKDRWILHPNVRYAVDTHLKGEPIEAVELRPGLAIATLGIPVESGLNYCYDCTASRRCPLHQPISSASARAQSPAPSALARLPTSASLLEDSSRSGRNQSPRTPRSAANSRTPRGRGAPQNDDQPDFNARSRGPGTANFMDRSAQRGGLVPLNGAVQTDYSTNGSNFPTIGPAPVQFRSPSPERETAAPYSWSNSNRTPEYERDGYSTKGGSYKDINSPKKRNGILRKATS